MKNLKLLSLLLLTGVIFSCEKNDEMDLLYDGPSYVSFVQDSKEFTAIGGEANAFEVEIGVNAKANSDRTFDVVVMDGSDGVEGIDYTIDTKTVTVKGGEVIGKFVVTPVFDNLPSAGMTINFGLVENNPIADYSIVEHSLAIGKYCTLDLTQFVGEYTVTDGEDDGIATIELDPGDPLLGLIIKGPLAYWTGDGQISIKVNGCTNTVTYSPQVGGVHASFGDITMTQSGSGSFDPGTFTISFTSQHQVSAGNFGTWGTTFTKN